MIERSFEHRRRPRAIAVTAAAGRERVRHLAALLLAAGLACAALVATARGDDDAPAAEPFPVLVAQPAKLVSRWPVAWPDLSSAGSDPGRAATVLVAARVGRDGRVRETRLVSSVPGLDDAAREAARRYEFEAARDEQGAEIESWVTIPLRWDSSVPRGAHGAEAIPARTYTDLERSFESDVETLRPYEVGIPNATTLELHQAIMQDANLLEVIPAPGADAIAAFLRGDTLARSPLPAKREGRKAAWAEAAHLAPWWPLPYRRLAAVAIAERDFDGAAACANVILAARSNDEEALAILKRTGQLRRAAAPKKSKK